MKARKDRNNFKDTKIVNAREHISLFISNLTIEYDIKKKEGLTIEALGLCVSVGRWQLAYLFKENQVDTSHDPWTLRGCKYSSELGLEI
ncbi:MAG: hypothetical protein WA323_27185 [Candidatus Nitrosopolaris sp.]